VRDRVAVRVSKYGRVSVQQKGVESSKHSPVLCPFHKTCSSLLEDRLRFFLRTGEGRKIEEKINRKKRKKKTWKKPQTSKNTPDHLDTLHQSELLIA